MRSPNLTPGAPGGSGARRSHVPAEGVRWMPVMVLDPNLRAGWEPDTPVTDSLLRRFLVNWTLGIEAQGLPLGGRSLQRDDLAAVDVGRPTVGANVATLLAPL